MTSALLILANASLVAGIVMLAIAAGRDIMARMVPNTIPVVILAIGLFYQSCLSLAGRGELLLSFGAAAVVFILAALLWRRGLMGGADVKLFGASALLLPPGLVPSMVMAISLAGGLLALVYLASRRRLARPRPLHAASTRSAGLMSRVARVERWRLRRGGPLPYAVAIASGVLFVMLRGGSF